jgi:hypothetical protein
LPQASYHLRTFVTHQAITPVLKDKNMLQNNEISAQYEASMVEGRSEWCPRTGVYRILSLYKGTCLNKPAIMARANWKPFQIDDYSEVVFEIQVESLLKRCDCFDKAAFTTGKIIGHEVLVLSATYNNQKAFDINWEIIPVNVTLEELMDIINEPLTISQLNSLISVGMFNPDLNVDFDAEENDSELDCWDY